MISEEFDLGTDEALRDRDTSGVVARDLCLHEQFESVAARRADAIALVYDKERLTYRELDRRANYLAHQLRKLGVRREVLVGVYVERSIEMVVSLLAILKAGGAYVPIDRGYPLQRVAFMLDQTQLGVLITQPGLAEHLPPHSAALLYVETNAAAGEGRDDAPLNVAKPADLAYVIFTSGSTGVPKGVQVAHASVISLFEATQPLIGFTDADVWSVFHSYAFDLSVWEIFGCLLSGGRLVIVPGELTQRPGDFCDLLRNEEVTLLSLTPSALRQLAYAKRRQVAEGYPDLSLRLVVCGGEALPPDLALQVLEWDVPLWNFYGPTEATVWATAGRVERRHCHSGFVNIGRPLSNCELSVLDSNGDPLPTGQAGELFIGGRALARGYLNRPDLTDARFLRKGAAGALENRIYRTGDIGRYQPDGTLEFLGRADEQVKIRGYRIELGEIEAALARHPETRQCVVAAREAGPGDKRLVAYVVRDHAASVPVSFRDFLREILPDYMVPSAYVFVDALPVTANGKIDRLRLPPPEDGNRSLEASAVPPADELEAELVRIWRGVLGLKDVGAADSFFDLGGDSLMAVQLFCEIEKLSGKYLPLATLLHTDTIIGIAKLIRSGSSSARFSSLVPIQPEGNEFPLFCIHPGTGTVLGFKDLLRCLGRSRPIYGLESRGLHMEAPPLSRVEEMAVHYKSEIRKVQPVGPYSFVGVCFGALVGFEMAQQLQAEGEEVDLLCMLDPDPPDMYLSRPSIAQRMWSRLDALRGRNWGERASDVRERTRNLYHKLEQLTWRLMFQTCQRWPGDLPRFLWNVEFANLQAARTYVPKPIACPITIFRAEERPAVEDVSQMAWRRYATGALEVLEVPGDHVTMMKEPHVRVLATRLQDCLRRAACGAARILLVTAMSSGGFSCVA